MRRFLLALALLALAGEASAQTRLIDHQAVNQAEGTATYTGNIPDIVNSVTLRIARATTATPTFWASSSTAIQVQSYISTDSEATWITWVGCGGSGGIHVRRDSTEAHEMVCRSATPLPRRAAVQRRYRIILTVVGPTLVTEATLEIQP